MKFAKRKLLRLLILLLQWDERLDEPRVLRHLDRLLDRFRWLDVLHRWSLLKDHTLRASSSNESVINSVLDFLITGELNLLWHYVLFGKLLICSVLITDFNHCEIG